MEFLRSIDPNVLIAIITGVGGYITARMQSKSENNKQLEETRLEQMRMFSQDQQEFRSNLMEEFRRSREQLTLLQEQNDSLVLQNVDLRKKIVKLQEQNDSLLMEVNRLRIANNALLGRTEVNEQEEQEQADQTQT